MPNDPLTRHQGGLLAKMILLGMFVQLGVIGYVFYQSYVGRQDTVYSQRAGCERNKRDRDVNAQGWRIAEAARRAEGQTKVADRYAVIAKSLERRSRIDCAVAYPKVSFIP